MDTLHRAGKQLHKDIASYYQANPEFAVKQGAGASAQAQASAAASLVDNAKGKGKKKRRKAAEEPAEEEVKEEEVKITQEQKVKKLVEEGGEVNKLDSRNVELSDPETGKFEGDCVFDN